MASLYQAGFEVADVTVTDILGRRGLNLESFRGLVFPGGFSFADVLGSARGWAASLQFNQTISEQLQRFKNRPNTFSLGVCNGCQLLALLGWVGGKTGGAYQAARVTCDPFPDIVDQLIFFTLVRQQDKPLFWRQTSRNASSPDS